MTDTTGTLKAVSDWFAGNGRAGLHLPGGWFGRPYDNAHQLTWSAARSSKAIIELDGQLLLILTDPGRPLHDAGNLIVPFTHLVFDGESYGDRIPHTEQFETASLSFMKLPFGQAEQ